MDAAVETLVKDMAEDGRLGKHFEAMELVMGQDKSDAASLLALLHENFFLENHSDRRKVVYNLARKLAHLYGKSKAKDWQQNCAAAEKEKRATGFEPATSSLGSWHSVAGDTDTSAKEALNALVSNTIACCIYLMRQGLRDVTLDGEDICIHTGKGKLEEVQGSFMEIAKDVNFSKAVVAAVELLDNE